MTYPSGRVVQQAYDPIGRLTQVQSGSTNFLTISSNNYNAASQPTLATYGNGVHASLSYNSRLQLTSLAYAKGSSTYFSLSYSYTSQTVPGNNGQIQSITDNVDSTRSTTYVYDAWARLKSATNAQWTLTESYDRYGNRKSQSPPVLNNVTVDPSKNRLSDPAYSYDAAGNMTNDGQNTLVYDGENRMASSTTNGVTTNSTYDGNGLRVKKQVGSATATVYVFSGTKVIAEYASGAGVGSPTREYIYLRSALLATATGGTTTYHHADHLSVRLTTDTSGNSLGQQGHYPFGEQWYPTPPPAPASKWQFTSYERDSESNNDHAMARYDINRLGRFSSPDLIAGSISNPQSLNRYAYVVNDPCNLTDPLGLQPGCSFNIGISFQSPLFFSDEQQKRIDDEINDIFATAKLGVKIVQPGTGDYNIVADFTLGAIPAGSRSLMSEGARSELENPNTLSMNFRGSGRGAVFMDRVIGLIYKGNVSTADLATAVGRLIAHESGHELAGLPDLKGLNDVNIMGLPSILQYNPTHLYAASNYRRFTESQSLALQNRCTELRTSGAADPIERPMGGFPGLSRIFDFFERLMGAGGFGIPWVTWRFIM